MPQILLITYSSEEITHPFSHCPRKINRGNNPKEAENNPEESGVKSLKIQRRSRFLQSVEEAEKKVLQSSQESQSHAKSGNSKRGGRVYKYENELYLIEAQSLFPMRCIS